MTNKERLDRLIELRSRIRHIERHIESLRFEKDGLEAEYAVLAKAQAIDMYKERRKNLKYGNFQIYYRKNPMRVELNEDLTDEFMYYIKDNYPQLWNKLIIEKRYVSKQALINYYMEYGETIKNGDQEFYKVVIPDETDVTLCIQEGGDDETE